MTSAIQHRFWVPVLALVLPGLALFLPRLGDSGLWDPWEPKYAQTAREMADGGHWIVPFYREDPRLNKPPLTYWMIRGSQGVLGLSERAARLPSALLAILCPVLLGLAFTARGRPLEGFLAGAALLTGPQWLLLGRFATPDMPLAAFLGSALAAAIALPAAATPRMRNAILLSIAVLIAAAAMTDGLRGLLLPAWAVLGWAALRLGWKGAAGLIVVAALYHAGQLRVSAWLNLAAAAVALAGVPWYVNRRFRLAPRLWVLGSALFLLLVVPWFVAAHQLQPDAMSILGYKHGLNLGESPGSHTGPYDYVVRIVAVGALPWIGLALVGFVAGLGKQRDELACMLGGAWLGTVLFFTLAEAKMGHFYGVLQPAGAALAGIGAVEVVRRRNWTLALALAGWVGAWWIVWDRPARILETATVKSGLYRHDLFLPATIALAVCVAILLVCWFLKRPAWTPAMALPAIFLAGTLGLWLVPSLESKKSMRPLWQAYLEDRDPGDPIAMFRKAKDGGFYYSNNTIVRLRDYDELAPFLRQPGDTKYVIMPTGSFNRIMRDNPYARLWTVLDDSHSTHILTRFDRTKP